ncbi:MAG: hypothetical protein WAV20_19055, partial [Blastocatellia bacterium]
SRFMIPIHKPPPKRNVELNERSKVYIILFPSRAIAAHAEANNAMEPGLARVIPFVELSGSHVRLMEVLGLTLTHALVLAY